MNTKERATEIYNQHIALASTDGKLFRKTVMDQIMAELGVSLASAATHYNNCKKAAPVEGLGRPTGTRGARRVGPARTRTPELVPDNECFTVLELVEENGSLVVGRNQSFLLQGEASETFESRSAAWPRSHWRMIQGLGPNSGDTYTLDEGEKEIRKYEPERVVA